MGTPNVKSTKSRKARRGGRSPVKGFARSVIHYITKKRIFPKTAKCFPLKGRKKKPPEQLLLPLPDVNPPQPTDVGPSEDVATKSTPAPAPEKAPPRRRRTPLTPGR